MTVHIIMNCHSFEKEDNMSEFRIDELVIQESIENLYADIDNVEKSNSDNDRIVERIKERIIESAYSHLRNKAKKRRDAINKYRHTLSILVDLIQKQVKMLDNMLDVGDEEFKLFLDMKKQLLNYSMRIYSENLKSNFRDISEEEKRIYDNIILYDILQSYYEDSNALISAKKEKVNERNEDKNISASRDWKTYYYLIICMDKQKEHNKRLITHFEKLHDKENSNRGLFSKICDYYVADLQGQLSKNIYCQRKRAKLTQQELSEKSGIDRTMIAKIEKVQQPTTFETATKLLTSLNMGIMIYSLGNEREKSLLS